MRRIRVWIVRIDGQIAAELYFARRLRCVDEQTLPIDVDERPVDDSRDARARGDLDQIFIGVELKIAITRIESLSVLAQDEKSIAADRRVDIVRIAGIRAVAKIALTKLHARRIGTDALPHLILRPPALLKA